MKKLLTLLMLVFAVTARAIDFFGNDLYMPQLYDDGTGADYVTIHAPTTTLPGDADGLMFYDAANSFGEKYYGMKLSAAFTKDKIDQILGIDYSGLVNKPTLGTASGHAHADYATAAQGTKADTALQSINTMQVLTALTYIPYNNSNPAGFITTAGARSSIALTTTGSGAATYNSTTGALNIPTPSVGTGTVTSVGLASSTLTVAGTVTTAGSLTVNMPSTGTAGTYSGITTDAQGRVTAGTTRSFSNSPSAKTIQTTAAAANGFQVSSTRDAIVNYSVTIQTTVTLGGNSSGYVVLEIAATNSSTAGDWTEIGRSPSGQSGTIVIGLTLNQVGGGQLGGVVPAGYYTRLRSVNVAGTPTYTYNSGQEVQL